MDHEDDADRDTMSWRRDAVRAVLECRARALAGRGVERVDLTRIGGRTLAERVVAREDRPARDHATMDGFAFDATGDYPFAVVSEVFPEDAPPEIEAGEAVEIATGAPLPERANAVLKREEATIEENRLQGNDIEPGTHVYRRGSNVAAGEVLFEPGERLSPKDAILLCDLGVDRVPVYERFRVGVLATGTEIHEGRQADFDSAMLCGLVEAWGGEAVYEKSVPDERDRVRERIDALAADYDVVITTGGTSVGKKDYTIRALSALGDVSFQGVRLRPGKPLAVASLSDHDAVAFAIPGKPIGAHTVATLVVRPFFTGEPMGRKPTIEARLARDIEIGRAGFEYAVPVTLRAGDEGRTDGAFAETDGEERGDEGRTDGAFAEIDGEERGDDGTRRETGIEALPLGHIDSPLRVYEERFDPSVLSSSTRATRADGLFLTESNMRAGELVSVIPYTALE